MTAETDEPHSFSLTPASLARPRRWPGSFVELSAARPDGAPMAVAQGGPLLPGVQVLVLDETGGGTRCHKQPAAEAAVTAAAAEGFVRVVVGSCGNYGWAVARAAQAAGVDATVVVPGGFTVDVDRMLTAGAVVVRAGATYESAVAASRGFAGPHRADVNVDGPYGPLILAAHRAMVNQIATLPGDPPAAVWVPLGNGTTVAAVAADVLDRGWSTAVVGVSSAGNNSVAAAWPARQHRPLDGSPVHPTEANEPLVNVDALHGQAALGALHATGGAAFGVQDAALLAARDLLRRRGLRVSAAGSAGLAGLLQQAARGGVRRGRHVAVLTA